MKIFDVRDVPAATDARLAVTENPRHRHILENFRRHGLLEVSGLWQDILVPTMTVEQPLYRLMIGGRTCIFDGMDEVASFYRDTAAGRENVFGPLEEEIAVSDHGIFSEALFAHVVRGTSPMLADDDVDPDKVYQITHYIAMTWPYVNGRLRGEHVYDDRDSRVITEVDESAITTPEEARRILAPYLADSPLSKIEEGLALFAS
ncbi:hypothetical protein ACQP1O_16790 [Nocardia sp. CA-151230]|uniref:hypothetical protein n=1 Tax=Nocardia sp. CA-151230 TaxID=3239982 RepID=UPI003D93833C